MQRINKNTIIEVKEIAVSEFNLHKANPALFSIVRENLTEKEKSTYRFCVMIIAAMIGLNAFSAFGLALSYFALESTKAALQLNAIITLSALAIIAVPSILFILKINKRVKRLAKLADRSLDEKIKEAFALFQIERISDYNAIQSFRLDDSYLELRKALVHGKWQHFV